MAALGAPQRPGSLFLCSFFGGSRSLASAAARLRRAQLREPPQLRARARTHHLRRARLPRRAGRKSAASPRRADNRRRL